MKTNPQLVICCGIEEGFESAIYLGVVYNHHVHDVEVTTFYTRLCPFHDSCLCRELLPGLLGYSVNRL